MKSDEEDNEAQSDNEDDEVEALELQYEMCDHLYEALIPRSLEYFLEIALPGMGDCCGEEGCDDGTCAIKGDKNGGKDANDSD